MTLQLPEKDKLTIKWLLDYIPLSWWMVIGVALGSVFTLGFTLSRKLILNSDIESIKKQIEYKQKLQAEIETLKNEELIIRAKIARIKNLPDEKFDSNNRDNISIHH